MLRASYNDGYAASLSRLGLVKLADVTTERKPHQLRVSDRIRQPDQPGLVVVHGLGSGKTLTALGAQDDLGMAGTAIVPAALKANLKKEQDNHIRGGQQLNVRSMQDVAMKGKPFKTPLTIVDEAHRARDPSSATFQALAKSQAGKRLLLTASPFYNHPSDISALVDLAAHDNVLPLDPAVFSSRYIVDKPVSPGFIGSLLGADPGVRPEINPKRTKELKSVFDKWVDFHPGSTEGFPTVEREDVKVPMSAEQLDVYDTLFHKAPWWVAYKVKHGLPPSKREAKQLNAFLSGARQSANSTGPYISEGSPEEPKIQEAFNHLQQGIKTNPNMRAVIYSNFLDAGINPYKRRLQEANIPYGEFTGQMPHGERDQLVKDYNAGKLRALLLSSAGGEGLDLKGTRLMQMLEPHWNEEKIKQVEGRGIRFKSHDSLPENERSVKIERYLATRPPKGTLENWGWKKPGESVDEYLAQLGADKESLIQQFRALMEQQNQETK